MRGRVGAMGALVLLALCACTSSKDDGSGPVSSSPASVTASPVPSVVRPVKPEQEPTRQSAEAFVKYFWETYNYGYDAGDPSLMKEISKPGCEYCSYITDNVESVAKAATSIQGSHISVLGSITPDYKIVKGIIVVSKIRQEPGVARNTAGEVKEIKGYRSLDSTVAVDWDGSAWSIAGVNNDPKSQEDW